MFDTIRKDLDALAVHALGIAQFVEGLEHKFVLEIEAKFEAMKAELLGGVEAVSSTAVAEVGAKVDELTGKVAVAPEVAPIEVPAPAVAA